MGGKLFGSSHAFLGIPGTALMQAPFGPPTSGPALPSLCLLLALLHYPEEKFRHTASVSCTPSIRLTRGCGAPTGAALLVATAGGKAVISCTCT